jgi:hypothetical protein
MIPESHSFQVGKETGKKMANDGINSGVLISTDIASS